VAVQTEEFHFSVDGALLGELGEKLVSSVHVAVSELVKNSYDADATKVTLHISPQPQGGPKVVVEDNGTGMTEDQIADYWMRIGTANKQYDSISPIFGRRKTGSKGVGRFACRRLGSRLRLTTTAKIGSRRFQTTVIDFDWSAFRPGDIVESVPCVGAVTSSASGSPGTKLEIWGASYDEWSTRGYNYLRRQLALLASNREIERPGFERDPGFNLELRIHGQDQDEGVEDIRESIVKGSWGTLQAHVDRSGVAHCSLTAKGLRGEKSVKSPPSFKGVAGAKLRLGILPLEKSEARDPSLLAEFVLDTITAEWGGIHVRFNAFRMMPYGDPGDDWLKIDADRGRRLGKPSHESLFDFASRLGLAEPSRSILNMLGMRNYFGQVEVDSTMSGLVPRIDRQGFLETEAFDQLKQFVRYAVEWATIYRQQYIQNRVREETQRAREALRPVLNLEVPRAQVIPKAAAYLKREVRKMADALPESVELTATTETLIKTINVIEASTKEDAKTLQHLRLVASASTLTFLFAHEVRTAIGTLGLTSKRLLQLSTGLPQRAANGLKELSGSITESKQRLETLVDMTGVVGVVSRDAELKDLNLKTAIKTSVRCFALVQKSYGIEIDDSNVPNRLIVGPLLEGELYTVLINLLSNSIKSVIAAAPRARKIKLEAESAGRDTLLRILDNGLGLPTEHYEDVFTAFVSDPTGTLYKKLARQANPEDAHVFGAGSGLGLSIVRDILLARKGAVRFVEPVAPWAVCIEVKFP
jgi:signal transduction histidine kinase